MAAVVRILLLATIFANVHKSTEGSITHLRVPPDFGCANGRKDDLLRHRDISACGGSWEGHIKKSDLCSVGWHVCTSNDTKQLSSISFYEASHVDGCYAINAAYNAGSCQECTPDTDNMAAIGADCPHVDETSQSCFGKGKIDASCCSATYGHSPCSHMPWISGVVCCRDIIPGKAPTITVSPVSSMRVPVGQAVLLKCKATGDPLPTITWFKNDYPITMEGAFDEVSNQDDVVFSRLTLPNSTPDTKGLYHCRAENKHGHSISYSSDITISEPLPDVAACKDPTKQQIFSPSMVACQGRWKGPIKRATKQLCAKGWHVCGLKDRNVLNKLTWTETTSLQGCYAYDAATSDHFTCTKCSHRQKGNLMSGIGRDCGHVDKNLTSCLNKGRIDVWGPLEDPFDVGPSLNSKKSCHYQKGLTTGVMCCLKTKKSKGKRRKRKCTQPCGPNSHCSRNGVCKCDKGYKAVGDVCLARRNSKKGGKKKACAKVRCQNGGQCKRGNCVCPPDYGGVSCEQGIMRSWFTMIYYE
ncbi:unnamed protein product [Clavelina lepadiformis]|uniref:Ig-like domain-containing protein n=1 Tax=Clavelina lepadiformis TaxID=159417 RepID=A0ABP0H3W8_CLALP